MKKYILTLIIAFISIFTINAINVPFETTINNSISEVVINIPSTIKVFESFDNNIHIRVRTKNQNLLNDVYYTFDENTLLFNSNRKLNYIDEHNIIIYLYVPNDNIKYSTKNNDLFVNTTKINNYKHKNINKSNHEELN